MARSAALHIKALKLMQRPTGVTVDEMVDKLGLETGKQARGIVDRLRAKASVDQKGQYNVERGTKLIRNVDKGTFKAHKNLRCS